MVGVDFDIGPPLRGIGGSPATMVTPSPQRATGGHQPVVGFGEGDDQLRARQVGNRDGASAQASLPQRHRCSGSRDRGVRGKRGDGDPRRIGEHGCDGRPGGTQHPSGQTDAGKQRNRCDRGATLLENECQLDGPEFAVGRQAWQALSSPGRLPSSTAGANAPDR